MIVADTVAQAWEQLVIDIWEKGEEVPHSGREKDGWRQQRKEESDSYPDKDHHL